MRGFALATIICVLIAPSIAQPQEVPRVLKGHNLPVIAVCMPSGSDTLMSADLYGFVENWTQETHETQFGTGWVCDAAAFSPDGQCLAIACNSTSEVRLWDTRRQIRDDFAKPLHVIQIQEMSACLAFSADGKLLVVGGADGGISIWETATGINVSRTHVSDGPLLAVAINTESKLVATGGISGKVTLIPTHQGRQRKLVAGSEESMISALAFSPDGKTLAVSATHQRDESNCIFTFWNPSTANKIRQVTPKNPFIYLSSITFSPDGKKVAAAGVIKTVSQPSPNTFVHRDLGEVQVYSVTSGEVESNLIQRHPDPFTSILFSRDGHTLVAGCGDCNVYIWRIVKPK